MQSQDTRSRRSLVAILILAVGLLSVLVGGGFALRAALKGGTAPQPESVGSANQPKSIADSLEAARKYIYDQKPGSAIVILRAAAERWPDDQSVRLLLAEALLSANEMAQAYEQYDLAIHIGPANPEYHHVAGTLASNLGRHTDAEIHFRSAQQADPKNPKYPLYLAQVQRSLGLKDEAKASVLLATRLDATLGIAWAALAEMALEENKASIALGYIKRARELEPLRLEWRIMEARALLREHQPEKAATLLMAVPEPDLLGNPAALRELGAALALLGRTSEAAGLYVKAVGILPDNAELAYETALWLERDGQKSRAATFASHAAAKGFAPARALADRLESE